MYCCTRSGVGSVMIYSWLMDREMCGWILQNVWEKTDVLETYKYIPKQGEEESLEMQRSKQILSLMV